MRPTLVALCLAAMSAAGCSRYTQERQALIDFFEAARLRDTTVLGNMGTATFEPRTDGIVQQFDIDRVEAMPPRMENGQAIEAKHGIVNAQVRMPDGEVVPERLDVRFERPVGGRWMITQLRASRTSRAASSAPLN
jgi:hypothetical protein